MRIYLAGHNNFGNRGCEALVRSTVDVVRERFPDCAFTVPSANTTLDAAQWPQAASHGVQIVPFGQIPSRFIQWSRVCSRLPFLAGLPWPTLQRDQDLPDGLAQCDVVLSIGGDNYSLDYDLASLAYFVAIAEAGWKRGKPVILWGASVGPFSAMPAVERHMAAHLERFSHITVRESHSMRYLERIGITRHVTSVADSAFALKPQAQDTTHFWPAASPQGVIGLNVSPLIDRVRARHGNQSPLIDEAKEFIRHAVEAEGFSVLLVPHVAALDGTPAGSDQHLLESILAQLPEFGGRVQVVPQGANALGLKHAISCCRFFIGARTHATIAALSAGVPTLSIAYSVKALGINRDLFEHERYVVDSRTLNAKALRDGLAVLRCEEHAIRDWLAEKTPTWRKLAAGGVPILARLVEEKRATA